MKQPTLLTMKPLKLVQAATKGHCTCEDDGCDGSYAHYCEGKSDDEDVEQVRYQPSCCQNSQLSCSRHAAMPFLVKKWRIII